MIKMPPTGFWAEHHQAREWVPKCGISVGWVQKGSAIIISPTRNHVVCGMQACGCDTRGICVEDWYRVGYWHRFIPSAERDPWTDETAQNSMKANCCATPAVRRALGLYPHWMVKKRKGSTTAQECRCGAGSGRDFPRQANRRKSSFVGETKLAIRICWPRQRCGRLKFSAESGISRPVIGPRRKEKRSLYAVLGSCRARTLGRLWGRCN